MKTRHALSSFWLLTTTAALGVAAAGALPSAGCNSDVDTDPDDAGADGAVILDGGGTIPDPPDGASLCPQGACNFQTNAGCQANETCFPLPDGNGAAPPVCVGAGQSGNGVACTETEQCAPGFVCAAATCRKLCCGGDWTACPSEKEHCIQNVNVSDGRGGTIPSGAMVCLPVNECDPLAPQVGCPEGTECLIVDPTGATACFPPGAGGQGDACPCKGGFLCVDGECRRLCKAAPGGGEPSCQEGEGICVHFVRDPPGVGECTPQ